MAVPFIETVKTVMGAVRQELKIKGLVLSILREVKFCKTLKLRCPLGSWVWVLTQERSGLEGPVQRVSSIMIVF